MRIIAGRAGGIRLAVPPSGVRPTMDRVKAAIFSSLGDWVIGARVLDLFAGSGALGIEALSRGAASALFVDEDRQSISTIEKNLSKAHFQAQVRRQEVFDFLKHLSSSERFRIIFADPPYERTKSGERFTEKLLTNKALPQLLEPGGIFVLEKRPGEKLSDTDWWAVMRRKTYGATEVLFLSPIRDQCQSGSDQSANQL
jgi:16S rRNA (guanine966-N2)-methyltransferase